MNNEIIASISNEHYRVIKLQGEVVGESFDPTQSDEAFVEETALDIERSAQAERNYARRAVPCLGVTAVTMGVFSGEIIQETGHSVVAMGMRAGLILFGAGLTVAGIHTSRRVAGIYEPKIQAIRALKDSINTPRNQPMSQ